MKYSPKKLGILGGGQLACMLAEAARDLGQDVLAYVKSSSEPIAIKAFQWSENLSDVFKRTDTLIFENEFVELPDEEIKEDLSFFPSLKLIRYLCNKVDQKLCLKKLGIQTSPFEINENGTPLNWVKEKAKQFSGGAVVKWAERGYDGHGVKVLDRDEDIEEVAEFCQRAVEKQTKVYAEEKIDFRRELALVSCRAKGGDLVFYPLVISNQENSICKEAFGPATSLGVDPILEEKAKHYARKLSESLDLNGCFAIEFFETKDGRLLVNEIAPRVHNSGHFSQWASDASQFENHIRAACEMELIDPKQKEFFGMINLLGPLGTKEVEIESLPALDWPEWSQFYWYDKLKVRPCRKMGHINFFAKTKKEFDLRIEQIKNLENEFWKRIQKTGDVKYAQKN